MKGDKRALFLSIVSLGVQLLELKWGEKNNKTLSLRKLSSFYAQIFVEKLESDITGGY